MTLDTQHFAKHDTPGGVRDFNDMNQPRMQVADFRAVEEHAGGGGAAIAEMPVHVADLFGGRDEP